MKVLFLSTMRDCGGAAIAAGRLERALKAQGIEVQSISRKGKAAFLAERLQIFLASGLRVKGLFRVDTASFGESICSRKEFREADIIHLHWINQGFVSLSGIRKIMLSGKPVVWTLHDMWPITGICHHSGSCNGFAVDLCRNCPINAGTCLSSCLAGKVMMKKLEAYRGANLAFACCSDWIAGKARESLIARDHIIRSIPNTIDTDIFSPRDKAEARKALGLPVEGKLLLFCAQKTGNETKGLGCLMEALKFLPEDLGLIVLGKGTGGVPSAGKGPVHIMGYTSDPKTLALIYNASDAFVTPSVEDNFPNTVMEAMACGLPCVGFETGGIPQMIGDCGIVVGQRSANALAEGIMRALQNPSLGQQASLKVLREYGPETVAEKYISLYRSLL